MTRRATPRASTRRKARPRPPRPAPPRDDTYVVIGEVGRAVGLHGEVRVFLHNPDSDLLEPEAALELVDARGEVRATRVVERRDAGGYPVVRFDGVDDRDSAEAVRGARLRVPRDSLAAPSDGEYYVWDLERCRITLAGEPFGEVARVVPYPTCEVLVVRRPDGTELEVPMHEDFVREVRIDEAIIDLVSVDGLIAER